MKTLQLYHNGKEILATDGIMYVDGRFNHRSIVNAVKERNNRYEKNFPHKVATEFGIYAGRIGSAIVNKHSL